MGNFLLGKPEMILVGQTWYYMESDLKRGFSFTLHYYIQFTVEYTSQGY